MPPGEALPVFTEWELAVARQLLASKVAYMMGRKFEEGDWTAIYCRAKAYAVPDWSNLNVDVELPGLAIEQKMLKKEDSRPITDWCGTWLMHRSLTRQISLPAGESDPNEAMRKIVADYERVLESRRKRNMLRTESKRVEMRSGWLIYQSSLREFMYFEEETRNLDPAAHYAEWSERSPTGARRGSQNLWIYESATGQKIWSITGSGSGSKIQPYFRVPPKSDPNLYVFAAQGLRENGLVKVWLTLSTYRALSSALSDELSTELVSQAIMQAEPLEANASLDLESEAVREVLITEAAYARLREAFVGASDEHSFQLLVRRLSS